MQLPPSSGGTQAGGDALSEILQEAELGAQTGGDTQARRVSMPGVQEVRTQCIGQHCAPHLSTGGVSAPGLCQ